MIFLVECVQYVNLILRLINLILCLPVLKKKKTLMYIYFSDPAVQTAVNLLHIEGDHQNIRKQSADIVHIREAEEEIEIQKVIKAPEAVIPESKIEDVIVPAPADHILQIAQEKKLDPLPERNLEVLPVVHNRINRKLILKRVKLL